MAALFGYHAGRVVMVRLFPETHALSEDDLWSFEIVPRDGTGTYLNWEVSRPESAQKPPGSVTQRILKLLAAAL